MREILDVAVIGGGQSGLACGYYLNRSGLRFKILDKNDTCGGSWLQMWDSLHLFSPAEHSSLPGWMMPRSNSKYPSKEEVISYLCQYENRYQLPVIRPVEVFNALKTEDYFTLKTSAGTFYSKTVISATGTWENPVIPSVKARSLFKGDQFHVSEYKNPEKLQNKKVLIVGEGNSGAQILSELSQVTVTKWATLKEPAFLPDDVDGKVLFNIASAKYRAQKEGIPFNAADYNLGNIVMVPAVKEARQRNVLKSAGMINGVTETGVEWKSGETESFDVIIWCTGFNYNLVPVKDLLNIDERGRAKTAETRSLDCPGLWLVGYGGWTGYASATLIGVGRTARQTVKEIETYLQS